MHRSVAAPRWNPLPCLALLALAGCPPALADDDSSETATPALAELSPAIERELSWPDDPVPGSTVTVDPAAFCPEALDPAVDGARDAYRSRDRDGARTALEAYLTGGGEDPDGSIHLLMGAILREDEDHAGAVSFLEIPALATGPLAGEAAMMLALSLEDLDRKDEAAEAFARVPAHSRDFDRARVRHARLTLAAGDAEGALTALLPLLADPAELGSNWRAEALVLLGECYEARGGEGDPVRAYEAYRTAWSTAPLDDRTPEAEAAMERLHDQVPEEHHPAVVHRFARAAAYHQRGHWKSTLDALEEIEADMPADDDLLACEFAYYRGRSLYKRKAYGEASPHLRDAAALCADIDPDMAVKATYVRAQGLARDGSVSAAQSAYLELPANFPEHSYADDGYYQAALLALDAGATDKARGWLRQQVDVLPDGDMAGKALWRLAWAEYRAGDSEAALAELRRLLADPPDDVVRRGYLRARYWEAKITGWPDSEGRPADRDPDVPAPTPDREAAAEMFAALAEEHPLSYYGLMAYHRLKELDASAAAEVNRRLTERRDAVQDLPVLPASWEVDTLFWDRPERASAVALACAGLVDPATAELRRARENAGEWDWATEQAISRIAALAGNPNVSHFKLRVRFRTDHPEQLTPASWPALHLAYPLAYGAEVRGSVAGKAVPALMMQGLVREESAFHNAIVSYAGAAGLSQLMWATARGTAKQMGIVGLKRSDLEDPETNLAIGATYLDKQLARFEDSPYCALGAYNAGPGAVERWLAARSGYPADEWVEEIPYKQTRNYVKVVLQSYQTYAHLYENGPMFVEVPLRVPRRDPK